LADAALSQVIEVDFIRAGDVGKKVPASWSTMYNRFPSAAITPEKARKMSLELVRSGPREQAAFRSP
jgi:hypothetical protein